MTVEQTKSATDLAVERTDLAVGRSRMAAERTLMAWIRTALSMISFGFTIFKVLQSIQQGAQPLAHASTPRVAGLVLVGLGTLSIIMGSVEHVMVIRELRAFAPLRLWRASFIIAIVMSVMGLLLFAGIIRRMV